MKAPPPRLTRSIEEVCQMLGITRPTLYKEIHAGRLRTITIGRRRMVTEAELARYLTAKEG